MPPIVLELFSGTHSVGKIAKQKKWKVISVDADPTYEPTICCDICKWNHRKLGEIPDFIWASPPCTTYSLAATWVRHRDPQTAEPLSRDAIQADKILKKTMQIIRYFAKLNPDLRFCIENPRGYMRRKPEMQSFERTTTSYNNYDFPLCKPTDFWTNYPLQLMPVKFGGITIGKGDWVKKLREATGNHTATSAMVLGRIPPKLVRRILKQATVGQATVGQATVGQATVGQATVGQATVGQAM